MRSGFNGHILKPFREEKLYSKICNLLHIKHHENFEPQTVNKKRPEHSNPEDRFNFDTSMLEESARGNTAFFNKMLGVFIENAEKTASSFSAALKDSNWSEIGEKAHKAIPSFKYFGLQKQVDVLAKIEYLALREKIYDKIPALVNQSIDDINELIVWVQKAKL